MNTNIYNFQYDFEQQNGHFMVIKGQETDQIISEDLANVQVNMLKSNTIDKILKVEIEEIDFNVKLYYNITGKRILSHVLREESLSINDLYQLLYQIVSGIEGSQEYMLNEQQYIVQEDFIFIGKDFNEISLTYLPLKEVENKADLKDEIRELLFKLVGQVKELTGNGVQQLMNELSDDNFSLSDLKKKLHQLRNQSNSTRHSMESVAPIPVAAQSEQASQYQDIPIQRQPIPKSNPVPKSKPVPKQSHPRKQLSKAPKSKVKKANNENKGAMNSGEEQVKKQKKPNVVVIGVVAIIPIIAVWKAYETMPSNLMQYISIGVSVLSVIGAVVAYIVMKNKGAAGNNSKPKVQKTPKKSKQASSKPRKKKVTTQPEQPIEQEQNKVPSQHAHSPHNELNQAAQQSATTINEEAYFKNLQNQTTLLSAEPGTVLLNEEVPSEGTAYLEVQRSHGPERIPINQTTFTVGRNPSGIEYVEDSVGISRIHFEIEINQAQFKVKDLGAKNGTKLNNEPMIAYKVYPLHDGDVITAGKIEYTLKKG